MCVVHDVLLTFFASSVLDLEGAVTVHKLDLCAMILVEELTRHKQHEGLSEEP